MNDRIYDQESDRDPYTERLLEYGEKLVFFSLKAFVFWALAAALTDLG